jgi:hypothetical protein
LVLFLIPLQFVHLFCNCILLFFSCISSLLLLFFVTFISINLTETQTSNFYTFDVQEI